MILKFKNRIALYNTFSVAITVLCVFSCIYGVTYFTAMRHLDTDIRAEKAEIYKNLDWINNTINLKKISEWNEDEMRSNEVNPTFIQIVDKNGGLLFHSNNLKKDEFLFNPKIKNEYFFNSKLRDQHVRLGQFAITDNDGNIIGQLTIGISQQESHQVLENLLFVLYISFPILLLVQLIASWLAASKAIRPIYQLIKTTSGINHSTIATRLTLPERKDEIYQLAQTINELLERIEFGIQQQKQFTSDASHEIRTPLSAIRGTLEVLIRKKREPSFYEEKIKEVITQTDRLDNLLEQLLQLARLESGINLVKKETTLIAPIILSVIEKYRNELELKKINLDIKIDDDTKVNANKFYLEIILDNLISNAIKYGKEDGTIHIEWNKLQNALQIQDDGIGISEENIPRLFNRFYRADISRSNEIKGNGLGLSIVKKLADLQKITIVVTSKLSQGTTFTLHF